MMPRSIVRLQVAPRIFAVWVPAGRYDVADDRTVDVTGRDAEFLLSDQADLFEILGFLTLH
jgi:hypothetical protein